ncbi:hypothetical protein [Amycolatopsis sp. H20-H5]|uniref:hypothetical protein n=1 Tax=Amycolatopsis sp. H20-H5 TaxID=3046309 RepID=UPI002DBC0930|nr:hypothetical protein [Amycolatopsis sp. H20-H5]MEC3980737.1 hypothetical protein [Amycolatopsis sp. H20-H5]
MDVSRSLRTALAGTVRESRLALRTLRRDAEDEVARRAGRTANLSTELGERLAELVGRAGGRIGDYADRGNAGLGAGVRRGSERVGGSLARWSDRLGDHAVLLGEKLVERDDRER